MDSKKVILTKKKSFKSFLRKIKRLFNKLIKKFNNLDSFYKKIIYCWGVGLIILILLLVFLSFKTSSISSYTEWEDKVKTAALQYAQDNDLYPTGSNPLIVYDEALASENYISMSDSPNKSCVAYGKVIYSLDEEANDGSGEYKGEAYLNCKSYTTEGFSANKK